MIPLACKFCGTEIIIAKLSSIFLIETCYHLPMNFFIKKKKKTLLYINRDNRSMGASYIFAHIDKLMCVRFDKYYIFFFMEFCGILPYNHTTSTTIMISYNYSPLV
jgi:hypothetical protein